MTLKTPEQIAADTARPDALNSYLEADDDEEPTSADERDYGKYLDQQFWGDRD